MAHEPYGETDLPGGGSRDDLRHEQNGAGHRPGAFVGGWYLEFYRERRRRGVLAGLETWPWNNPERVQVMLHDEDDDCSALLG